MSRVRTIHQFEVNKMQTNTTAYKYKLRATNAMFSALKGVLGASHCCCDYGIGHPHYSTHSDVCIAAQKSLKLAEGDEDTVKEYLEIIGLDIALGHIENKECPACNKPMKAVGDGVLICIFCKIAEIDDSILFL